MNKSKEFAKKRLMFIQKEDYNYLCYNFILLLDVMGCTEEKKSFKDFKKIAYLVDFISANRNIDEFSEGELGSIYSKAQLKKTLLSHLLVILKNRDMIGFSLNKIHTSFDIWLKKDNIPSDFFNYNFFKKEKDNIEYIKNEVRRIRTTTVKTMVDRIFTSKNVMTWEI